MPKEPEDEIGALAESRKAAIHLNAEFVNAGRSGIAEMLFDIAVATLLGVQVRGANLVIIPFPPVGNEADLTRRYPEVMTSSRR